MSKKGALGLLIALTYILSLTRGCQGAMKEMDIDDLTQEADVILIGEVTVITTHEGEDTIYRNVEVRVEENLKNPLNSSEVVIRVLGGKIGDRIAWVEDQPSFNINESVLVFLHEESGGSYTVVGGPQGKLTLAEGSAANEFGVETTETELLEQINCTLHNITSASEPTPSTTTSIEERAINYNFTISLIGTGAILAIIFLLLGRRK